MKLNHLKLKAMDILKIRRQAAGQAATGKGLKFYNELFRHGNGETLKHFYFDDKNILRYRPLPGCWVDFYAVDNKTGQGFDVCSLVDAYMHIDLTSGGKLFAWYERWFMCELTLEGYKKRMQPQAKKAHIH